MSLFSKRATTKPLLQSHRTLETSVQRIVDQAARAGLRVLRHPGNSFLHLFLKSILSTAMD